MRVLTRPHTCRKAGLWGCQAKALESVLKDINSRFGKGSIMVLGEAAPDMKVYALPCPVLPCHAMPCLAWPCRALHCLALPCLPCPALPSPCLACPLMATSRHKRMQSRKGVGDDCADLTCARSCMETGRLHWHSRHAVHDCGKLRGRSGRREGFVDPAYQAS